MQKFESLEIGQRFHKDGSIWVKIAPERLDSSSLPTHKRLRNAIKEDAYAANQAISQMNSRHFDDATLVKVYKV